MSVPSATDDQVSNFLEESEDEQDEFDFIPDIETCSETNNGILKINIKNIDELWLHNEYDQYQVYLPCLKLFCKSIYDTNIEKEIEWQTLDILIGNIKDEGIFFLLLEAQLDCYKFIFKLQAHDKIKNKWMTETKQYIVNVPSFQIDIEYQINEWVDFRKIGEFQPLSAQIIDINNETNMFKLKYFEYDEEKDDGSYDEKMINVSIDRLYKESINNQYVTRVHSPQRMENDLLIKQNDKIRIKIWYELHKHYLVESLTFCYDSYDPDSTLIHYKSMSYFITQNIYQFLFEPIWDFKINCFINYYDGCLQLKNVRKTQIELMYENPDYFDNNDNNNNNNGDIIANFENYDNICYTCDWCWVDMSEYDYYYSCCININDKHDICLNCVSRVIRLNAELKIHLRSILDKQLIIDCIDQIAQFVIGGVRVIYNNKQKLCNKRNLWNTNKCNKRKLKYLTDEPCNKRQKLNNNNLL